jgi:predicted CoA-binding protein
MSYVDPPDETLRQLLTEARTIAVVGASSNPERDSYGIFRKLQSVGYRVIPVNPHEVAVLGEKAWPSLEAVPEPIDIVDVFRRAEEAPTIADAAVRVGARALWLQQGIASEAAATRARVGGLVVVMDRCIATAHVQLGIPKRPRKPPAPPLPT